jgi:ribosomal protein L44E
MTHACNPSYSRGRDQKGRSLKPARANSSQDPISKKTHHKNRSGRVAQGVGPEFKPQYHQKKKKEKESVRLRSGTCSTPLQVEKLAWKHDNSVISSLSPNPSGNSQIQPFLEVHSRPDCARCFLHIPTVHPPGSRRGPWHEQVEETTARGRA